MKKQYRIIKTKNFDSSLYRTGTSTIVTIDCDWRVSTVRRRHARLAFAAVWSWQPSVTGGAGCSVSNCYGLPLIPDPLCAPWTSWRPPTLTPRYSLSTSARCPTATTVLSPTLSSNSTPVSRRGYRSVTIIYQQ